MYESADKKRDSLCIYCGSGRLNAYLYTKPVYGFFNSTNTLRIIIENLLLRIISKIVQYIYILSRLKVSITIAVHHYLCIWRNIEI